MNRFYIVSLLLTILTPAFAAEETAPVADVKISPDSGKGVCASNPGKGITLVWGGTDDKRTVLQVGTLKKKDQELEVTLAKPVDAVIGEAVKTIFTNCGYVVDTKKDAAGVEIKIDVIEFFAGAKKGILTGETEAKGSLVLHFTKGGASYDFNLGATKSDKRLKKKNIKQLEEVLTGLLESIVTQVAESPALFDEIKKLSAK